MILLELRDGNILIPSNEFDSLFTFDWFLSKLISCKFNITNTDYEDKYILWESKNAVLSILDSIRFQELIIYDNTNLIYLKSLINKWSLPEWMEEKIEIKIEENKKKELEDRRKTDIKEKSNYIFHCPTCQSGFKLEENHNKACQIHSGILNYRINNESYFSCCGYQPLKNNSELKPCTIGYHIYSTTDYIFYLSTIKNNYNK